MKESREIESITTNDTIVKQLIWAYFWLLIFEGALRKWILPELSAPLLIIRDPIAILIFFTARNRGLFPLNGFILCLSIVGILGMFTSMVSGHGNFYVSLFGARPYLIHFPLIFIIGKVFDRNDVIEMGKATLLVSIPMAILIGLQFYSPQSSWVNRGLGGDVAGGGFTGALGYFRPPGTFSFTLGVSQFFSFVAVFVCFFWLSPKGVNLITLIGGTVSLIASIPFSISRALFFQVMITLLFTVLGAVRKPKHIFRITIAATIILVLLVVGTNTEIFQTSTEVLFARFDNASTSEGGFEGTILDRFFGGFVRAILNIQDLPIFGYGLGLGTNVASMLLRGYVDFIFAEDEWSRTIGELGGFLGLIIIFTRVTLTGQLFIKSFRALVQNDFLPWSMVSVTLLSVSQGNWAQPTSLGFCTIVAGLTLASLNDYSIESSENDL